MYTGGCGERTPVFLLAQLATLALIFWVTIGTPFVPSAADAARDAALKPAELVYYTVEDGSTVPIASTSDAVKRRDERPGGEEKGEGRGRWTS
jgi:hypothetical protein